MTTQVTVVSTKGGAGKTTLTANLGGILADLGQRVLLVVGIESLLSLIRELPVGLAEAAPASCDVLARARR